MELKVNGTPERAEPAITLACLLAERRITEATAGVAVAVNLAVVPKRMWPQTTLAEGDSVEIINAVQGG